MLYEKDGIKGVMRAACHFRELILAHTLTDELKPLLEVAALPRFLFVHDSTVVALCWTLAEHK